MSAITEQKVFKTPRESDNSFKIFTVRLFQKKVSFSRMLIQLISIKAALAIKSIGY
jgi:hypothetical protein|tara:strand:- start:433 stop:600 length:168 start_codon:yes stop_codon:yes gene_type:complete